MSHEYAALSAVDPDHDRASTSIAPGKRTLTQGMAPVQRKAAAPAETVAAAPVTEAVDDPFAMHLPVQRKNDTGLPDQLKGGIESLSGMSMDHVRVHRDSGRPAELGALAYAQGSDIHLGPGQEEHLPHEAWHVVQQAQGRVSATQQMKRGTPLNDDHALEHEADVMGARAMAHAATAPVDAPLAAPVGGAGVVQRIKGAPGTKQAGKKLEFTLNDDFVLKHVAGDETKAKEVTEARIQTGGPPSMVAGTLANHMASKATWTEAIKASDTIVPPDDVWTSECGDDGPQFVDKLASVTVDGFEAQGTAGNVVARTARFTRYVGGHWQVTGCEEDDEDGSYKSGTGTVSMDINHLTS